MQSINEYRALVAVVEAGSIRGAAEASELPRSTISRSIQRLEERLEVELFERTARAVRPTEAGRLLYDRARDFLREIAASEEVVRRVGGEERRLVVSLPRTAGNPPFRRLLTEFAVEYPDFDLRILATDRYVDLEADGVDVAIRAGRRGPPDNIARRLVAGRWRLWASESWYAAHDPPENLQQLWDHRLIVRETSAGELIWPFELPVDERADIHLRANDFAVVRDAVAAGLGIGAYPDIGDTSGTVHILPELFDSEAELCAFFRREDREDPRVRRFVDFAAEKMAEL